MNCQPIIETSDAPGPTGGHTTDDVRPDGSLGMRPKIVVNTAGLSQEHRAQLVAHEMVHARHACAEAQEQTRPHVGAEEVEAYWRGGTCDLGGYNRQAGQSKCGCVEQNSTSSCIMAGVSQDECRRAVRETIAGDPYNCP